jgi:hypothetical protein
MVLSTISPARTHARGHARTRAYVHAHTRARAHKIDLVIVKSTISIYLWYKVQ